MKFLINCNDDKMMISDILKQINYKIDELATKQDLIEAKSYNLSENSDLLHTVY